MFPDRVVPTFKLIALLPSTSNMSTSIMHPSLVKLAIDRGTAYNFSENYTKKLPVFSNIFCFLTFHH